MTASTMQPRQHWVALAQGMQHDVQRYVQLQDLLQQQFHAALRHDAAAMEQLAHAISAQAEVLAQAGQARQQHMLALQPQATSLSMRALLAQLKVPLQQQMQALWERLEQQVQTCKDLNVRNCQLIMEQAQLMRQVIGIAPVEEAVYGPR